MSLIVRPTALANPPYKYYIMSSVVHWDGRGGERGSPRHASWISLSAVRPLVGTPRRAGGHWGNGAQSLSEVQERLVECAPKKDIPSERTKGCPSEVEETWRSH